MLYACLGVSECVENSANWYSSPFGSRLLGYEGVEVINPEGGKEDAEEEAQRGRWKQEVLVFFFFFFKFVFIQIPCPIKWGCLVNGFSCALCWWMVTMLFFYFTALFVYIMINC